MKIAVLGIGAYGIAISNVLHRNHMEVTMWGKFQEELENVKRTRENGKVLPGVKIPEEVQITDDLEACVSEADIVILGVPMRAVRKVAKEVKPFMKHEPILCVVSKGIEEETNKLMSEVVYEETQSEKICMISGPSFAKEIGTNQEIGLNVASQNEEAAGIVKDCLQSDKVMIQVTSDIVGVQIAAAAKNVFAILSGMLDGLKKSDSTRAAVLTCLINDLRLVIEILGGKQNTIYSFAGIGDMLLTCMCEQSRNYRLGKNIGEGLSIREAMDKMGVTTVEGLYTLNSLLALLQERQIEVTSIQLLKDVLYHNRQIEDILRYVAN